MWIYITREQAAANDIKIPEEVITHQYFVGHLILNKTFYWDNSFEKMVDAMRCVNYLNGGTGDSPPSFFLQK